MGDRRQPSSLVDIQPDHWLPEYTTELLNVLNVLAMLVELEPQQSELLDRICAGPLISEDDLKAAGAFEVKALPKRRKPTKEKAPHSSNRARVWRRSLNELDSRRLKNARCNGSGFSATFLLARALKLENDGTALQASASC
jgi:hypothetical protein